MTDDAKIAEAWARYHGPPLPGDDEIPQAPPAYSRGYRDGVAAAYAEIDLLRRRFLCDSEWKGGYQPIDDGSMAVPPGEE